MQCKENDVEKCSDASLKECKNTAEHEYKGCFTQIDSNGVVIRGCLSVKTTDCTKENNCVESQSGGNNQTICRTCEESDENCSQTDMSSNDSKYNKICKNGEKKCLVKLSNKRVVRGCATEEDVKQCTDAKTCKTCENVFCNSGIFPQDRLQCYQCKDDSCADVTRLVSKPCLNYDDSDKCYTKGESETKMVRGCKSDTKDNQCSNTDGCKFCSVNNCNNKKFKDDQVLKCHQCTGNETSTDCFKKQESKEFKKCEKQIQYNDTEYCYIYVNGENIQRGCLYDNPELTVDKCTNENNGTCTKCDQNDGCNNREVSSEFTCIVCRSDTEPKCWNDAKSIKGKKCRTETSSAKDGCFHGIWNGVAIRGCLVDASPQVQEVCRDKHNHKCHVCNKSNCNTDKTSGAEQIKFGCAFFISILTILWNFK